jgi:peptide/nickel transport system permease protein
MLGDRTGAAAPSTARGLTATRASVFGVLLALVDFSRRKPAGAMGGGLVAILVLIAIFAPIISPFDPNEIHADRLFEGPGSTLLLGGDFAGRDVLSRLFHGARISLYVGLVSIAIGITAGSLLGAISAYYGGKFDLIIQRFVDAFIALPGIILALALMAALGPSVNNIIIALVAVLAPSAIRTVRSQALAIKEMDYVLAARAVGASDARIIIRHIVPNCMALFIILATINLGYAILVEASLSFLGVGVPPDVPTWGSMLANVSLSEMQSSWWLILFPGIFLAAAVFGINLLGDALRDVMDPRLRGS